MKIQATFTHAIIYCGIDICSLHTDGEEAYRVCQHMNNDDMQSDYYKVHIINEKMMRIEI